MLTQAVTHLSLSVKWSTSFGVQDEPTMQHHPYFFQELVEESGSLSRGDARSDSNPEWYPLVALAH